MPTKKRSLKRPLLFSLLAVAAVLFLFLDIRIVGEDPRPVGSAEDLEALAERDDLNVLFILVDTLRAHHLGSYGYERDTSPTVDAMAGSGALFAKHLSQSSWTKCSMASMWTSLYPARSKITRYEDALPESAMLPAEILQEAGFRTTGVYRNGWVAPNFGFAQGFEVYERPLSRNVLPGLRRENPTVRYGGSDDDLLHATEEFLEVHGHERWFLYLHFMDIHEYLYDEETAQFGTGFEDNYDNAILRTNVVLEKLLEYLNENGYRENTLIIFASDHGEAFSERGLEGHARYVYPETTEVPFILSFPFQIEPGIEISTRTENIDIWPTVLDLLGLPAMEGIDGQSRVPELLAAMRGEPLPERERPAIAHLDQHWGQRQRESAPHVVLADGDMRFSYTTVPNQPPILELFDASEDPDELKNVLSKHPEMAERLRELTRTYIDHSPDPPWGDAAPPLEIDEIQLNQLRALGYQIP